ncbi:MAG: DNA/RNA non-specific endonuclease [Oscillospiraceae bacterium]|nr:DNA/RNA non-specific endonuclease [Oscillospiraceae bacterium]
MKHRCLLPLFLFLLLLPGCRLGPVEDLTATSYTLDDLPPYSGEPYVILNDNTPSFPEEDMTANSFERYSQLDYFGRCGEAYAGVSLETMPTEERGNIGQVRPTGWQTVKYDFVDGKYLYNRCHLIGYQLTAENANELNLITGTRYLNVTGMLPFENEVAQYVKETGNHVLYRVTPIFEGADLLARGVTMEAWSVEDQGEGICFFIYAYNVQPGVIIDYATGQSWLEEEEPLSPPSTPSPEPTSPSTAGAEVPEEALYILNTSSRRFHLPTCSGAASIKAENRQDYTGTPSALLDAGYTPCGTCKP